MAVDDHEADRLLGDVVRWVHAGRGDEGEVRLGMLAKALGHVLRLAPALVALGIDQARRRIPADANDLGLRLLKRRAKRLL